MEIAFGLSACGSLDQWDPASGSLRHSNAAAAAKSRNNWNSSLMAMVVIDNAHIYVGLCPDGRRTLLVLEMGSLVEQLHCSLPEAASAMAFSRDGQLVAIGSGNGSIHIWSTTTGMMMTSMKPHLRSIQSLAFTNDGQYFCTASTDAVVNAFAVGDCIVQCDSNPVSTWTHHTLPVKVVVAMPISGRVLTGSDDRTCRLWRIGRSEPEFTFQYDSGVRSIVVDPAEAFFCVGMVNGSVARTRLLHSAASLAESSELTAPFDRSTAHSVPITSLALNADASQVASASEDGSIKIWDLISLHCLSTLRNSAHPRRQYRICAFQNVSQQFFDGAILNGVANVSELVKLGKLIEPPDARRSISLMVPGLAPGAIAPTMPITMMSDDARTMIRSSNDPLQTTTTAQRVELEALREDRDRWAQVASRLYNFASDQILRSV